MPVELDRLHLTELEKLERRLELVLRDLRIYRRELEQTVADKGILGSRSLTEYVLGLLQKSEGMSITDLLLTAEKAGYAIPTRRTMSKRLGDRAYRVGDIVFDHSKDVWKWKHE